jgi:hypothetical protein
MMDIVLTFIIDAERLCDFAGGDTFAGATGLL